MSEDFSALHLENQLCFPLYAASRLTTKLYAPYLAELDITYPQYLVLMVLWQHQNQSVSDIGKQLMLESNTLTPLLKRLEQKDLIARTRSKEDERTVIISLTGHGAKLKEKAVCVPQQMMAAIGDQAITEEEALAFRDTLWKLIGVLRK